jgi:hypothetical protein
MTNRRIGHSDTEFSILGIRSQAHTKIHRSIIDYNPHDKIQSTLMKGYIAVLELDFDPEQIVFSAYSDRRCNETIDGMFVHLPGASGGFRCGSLKRNLLVDLLTG